MDLGSRIPFLDRLLTCFLFEFQQIDLPSADPERVASQIEVAFELPAEDCLRISAKSNLNVDQILPSIIERVPPYVFYNVYSLLRILKSSVLTTLLPFIDLLGLLEISTSHLKPFCSILGMTPTWVLFA